MTRGPSGWWHARPLLICFAPIADPECPPDLLDIYATCGVDVAEVAAPTLDPTLDGPVVADSMRRVTARLDAEDALLEAIHVAHDRHPELRLVVMGYPDSSFDALQPAVPAGAVAGVLALAGADRSPIVKSWIAEHGIARIGFVDARESPDAVECARSASGYVMLQAYDGPTGRNSDPDPANMAKIARLRTAGIATPIVSGFGISSPEAAAGAISIGADGVVVGTACIEAARRGRDELREYLVSLRSALDAAQR